MQQLGLSPNSPKSQSRIRELLWPEITDDVAAETAARNGMYLSFFIAAVTTIFAVFRVVAGEAFFDAFLFLVIGIGIRKMWRTAAVAGLVLYVLEQIYGFAQGRGSWNIVVLIIFTAIFLSAVRASWWHAASRARNSVSPLGEH